MRRCTANGWPRCSAGDPVPGRRESALGRRVPASAVAGMAHAASASSEADAPRMVRCCSTSAHHRRTDGPAVSRRRPVVVFGAIHHLPGRDRVAAVGVSGWRTGWAHGGHNCDGSDPRCRPGRGPPSSTRDDPLPRRGFKRREVVRVVGGPDVLNIPRPTPARVHDLHRRRPDAVRTVRTHATSRRLEDPLSAQTSAIQTAESPKTRFGLEVVEQAQQLVAREAGRVEVSLLPRGGPSWFDVEHKFEYVTSDMGRSTENHQ